MTKVKTNSSVNITKTFNYSKNGVTLSFSLRTDVKNQLIDFKEILETALSDINKEIAE